MQKTCFRTGESRDYRGITKRYCMRLAFLCFLCCLLLKTSFSRRAQMAEQVDQECRRHVLEQEKAEITEESQNVTACDSRFSASSAASCSKTAFARHAQIAEQVDQEGRRHVLEQEQTEITEESQNVTAGGSRFSASSAASC